MKNPELLCLGCMEELECSGDTCRKCGFDRIEYEKNRNVHTLPSYTILAGKYLLGRVLGEGGFGITYIAWDLNRECRVAVKEYFPSGLATRDTRLGDGEALTIMPGEKAAYYRNGLKNFAEEGKNLARFQHLPGIVSVRDFFQDNGTAYIVMDYVEGKNLKQYLREHYEKNGEHAPMEENQILEMMQPLLQALSEIHKAGIIHRDISPENIICGEDGKITLIDFGAARAATGTETKSLTIMLKHGYAPEEQYRTRGKQGPWTDIYAICATMYQMASGYLPIESVERLYEDELKPLKQLNAGISEKFSDVIEKGMAVRGDKRYQSVEEIYKELYPKPKKRLEAEKVKPATEETQYFQKEKLEKQWGEVEKIRPNEEKQYVEVEKSKRIRSIRVVILFLVIVFFFMSCIGVPGRNTDESNEKEGTSVVELEEEPQESNMEKPEIHYEKLSKYLGMEGYASISNPYTLSGEDVSELELCDWEKNIFTTYDDYVESLSAEEQSELENLAAETSPLSLNDIMTGYPELHDSSNMVGYSPDYYFNACLGIDCGGDEWWAYDCSSKALYDVTEDEKLQGELATNNYRAFGYKGYIGYANGQGEIVIPPKFRKAGDFSDGLAPVVVGNYYGYINENGELTIPAVFEKAEVFSNGLAAVHIKSGEETYLAYIDVNGNIRMVFNQEFSKYVNFQVLYAMYPATADGTVCIGYHMKYNSGFTVDGGWWLFNINGEFIKEFDSNYVMTPFDEDGHAIIHDISTLNQQWTSMDVSAFDLSEQNIFSKISDAYDEKTANVASKLWMIDSRGNQISEEIVLESDSARKSYGHGLEERNGKLE
ncbi:protein kinase domain-containing protein [Faecalicatena contorta]|uniref:protein kinase domain-containing protein n=1 Tax=Faecalicatena contorta TaxID=39482 RepID=UPI001F22D664|nr:protein kinase [Faecalicatena contorta]MCF2682604.1 protein kinase [Faecalicatena contorta]